MPVSNTALMKPHTNGRPNITVRTSPPCQPRMLLASASPCPSQMANITIKRLNTLQINRESWVWARYDLKNDFMMMVVVYFCCFVRWLLAAVFSPPDPCLYVNPLLNAIGWVVESCGLSKLAVVVLVSGFLALLLIERPPSLWWVTGGDLFAVDGLARFVFELLCHGSSITVIELNARIILFYFRASLALCFVRVPWG